MDELVKTFHLNWSLLIAQIINFGIVLGVLWWLLLKPLFRVMDQRRHTIDQGLKDAKKTEEKLAQAEQQKEAIITAAKKESQKILEKTDQAAEQIKEEKIIATRQELKELENKSKADLILAKERMVKAAKNQVADLVITASSKIIKNNLDTETNQALVKETLDQVKK